MINMRLAKERKLPDETIADIENRHVKLQYLLANPYENYDTPEEIVAAIEDHEFTLQALWGFEVDDQCHIYWNKVEGCTCPKIDNQDLIGTPYRVYNQSCPFHGKSYK